MPGAVMKAMVIRSYGGPEVLEAAELPVPEPGPGEALVKVEAVSVNSYLDVVNRAGGMHYRTPPLPTVLGSEHAGEVVALGPGTISPIPVGAKASVINAIPCGVCDWCTSGRPNGCPDVEIIGVTRQGAYAEYTVVPVANLRLVPRHLSTVEAAGMNVLGPLAAQQLLEARAEAGAWVLVQAAASPSGVMAALVAHALGMRVVGTSRTPAKIPVLEALGLFEAVVDSRDASAHGVIAEVSSGHGMDVVIDNVGEPLLWRLSLDALAPMGSVVISGAKFDDALPIDTRRLYQRGQRIIGLRQSSQEARSLFWTLVEEQSLHPIIDQTFALADVASAHRRIEAGENIGRPVVVV